MKPKVDTVLQTESSNLNSKTEQIKPVLPVNEIEKVVKEQKIVQPEIKVSELSHLKAVTVDDEELEDIPFFNDDVNEEKSREDFTSRDYHKEWCRVVVELTDTQPILAMCASKAIQFDTTESTLNVGFEYDTNMLLLDDDKNKQIIANKLFSNNKLDLNFYLIDKPEDKTQEKIDRIKGLFDNKILKITKK